MKMSIAEECDSQFHAKGSCKRVVLKDEITNTEQEMIEISITIELKEIEQDTNGVAECDTRQDS